MCSFDPYQPVIAESRQAVPRQSQVDVRGLDNRVESGGPGKAIRTRPAGKCVITALPEQSVIAIPSVEPVVAATASQSIQAVAAEKNIVPLLTDEDVATCAAAKRICARPAEGDGSDGRGVREMVISGPSAKDNRIHIGLIEGVELFVDHNTQ